MPQKVRIPGKLLLTNFALVSLLACVCQKVLIAIRLPCEPLGAHWALEGSLTGVVIPHMLFAVVFPVVKAQVWSQIQSLKMGEFQSIWSSFANRVSGGYIVGF